MGRAGMILRVTTQGLSKRLRSVARWPPVSIFPTCTLEVLRVLCGGYRKPWYLRGTLSLPCSSFQLMLPSLGLIDLQVLLGGKNLLCASVESKMQCFILHWYPPQMLGPHSP